MYQTKKTINGTAYDTYYFETWSGYHHPINPKNPLTYPETQKRSAYYEASYGTYGKEPRLIFFEQIELLREAFPLKEKYWTKKAGDYYYVIQKDKDGNLTLGKEIRIEETLDLKEYILILIEADGRIARSETVQKQPFYSYEYIYNPAGLLLKAIIKNPEKTNVIEF